MQHFDSSNDTVVKDIIIMASPRYWKNGIIMDTPFGPVYEETIEDLPGRESLCIGPSHSKKKNNSKRVQYENTKKPFVKRIIPKKKMKKYPTKPKDLSKINKLKEKSIQMSF